MHLSHQNTHTHTQTLTHTHTHTYTHTHTNTHKHARSISQTHTCMHTHANNITTSSIMQLRRTNKHYEVFVFSKNDLISNSPEINSCFFSIQTNLTDSFLQQTQQQDPVLLQIYCLITG